MMREFAAEGDFHMVQGLRGRMWSDSAGSISPVAQGEADELLMEAAMNSHRVPVSPINDSEKRKNTYNQAIQFP